MSRKNPTGVKVQWAVNKYGERVKYEYPAKRYASSRYRTPKNKRPKLEPLKPKPKFEDIVNRLESGKTVKRIAKKGKYSPVLVSKSGKLYKDRVDAILADLKSQIKGKDGKVNPEALTKYNEARAIISAHQRDKERLTVKSLGSIQIEDGYKKMFANAGYSIEEAAEELGVSEEDLLDPENWESDVFSMGGLEVRFRIDYNKSIWVAKK